MNRYTQLPSLPKAHLLTIQNDGRKAICKVNASAVNQPTILTDKVEKVDCKNCLNKLAKYPK